MYEGGSWRYALIFFSEYLKYHMSIRQVGWWIRGLSGKITRRMICLFLLCVEIRISKTPPVYWPKKLNLSTIVKRSNNKPISYRASLQVLTPLFANVIFNKVSSSWHEGRNILRTKYILTYLLTPWSRVLLEKLTNNFAASQEIPRIYGNRKFLTVPTSARHPSLSRANSIQSPRAPPTSWRSILILSSHLRLGPPVASFPQASPPTLCAHLYPPPYAPHTLPFMCILV